MNLTLNKNQEMDLNLLLPIYPTTSRLYKNLDEKRNENKYIK